jgi:hypothetical protein
MHDPVRKNPHLEEKESYGDYDAAMALALSSENAETMKAIENASFVPAERKL